MKFVQNSDTQLKFWNLVIVVKFSHTCEIQLKLWNSVEIVKFSWNYDIRSACGAGDKYHVSLQPLKLRNVFTRIKIVKVCCCQPQLDTSLPSANSPNQSTPILAIERQALSNTERWHNLRLNKKYWNTTVNMYSISMSQPPPMSAYHDFPSLRWSAVDWPHRPNWIQQVLAKRSITRPSRVGQGPAVVPASSESPMLAPPWAWELLLRLAGNSLSVGWGAALLQAADHFHKCVLM